MKKTVSLVIMGEPFEITLEEEFFEFVKEDLAKLQKNFFIFFLTKKKSVLKSKKKSLKSLKS